MKSKFLKKTLSIVICLSMILSTGICACATANAESVSEDNGRVISQMYSPSSVRTKQDTSGFESETSFLTQDQYLKLGFAANSAASYDNTPDVNPLLGKEKEGYKGVSYIELKEVSYGWSCPQVLTVLLSSPYWNEVYYGDEMTASGQTTFTVSSGIGSSSGTSNSVEVGAVIMSETEIKYRDNGITVGGGYEYNKSEIDEVVNEKCNSVSETFSCGASTDNIVLYSVPIATYHYVQTTDGKVVDFYTQIPLSTDFSVVALETYNDVACEVNSLCDEGEYSMLVVDMQKIYPGYTAGDPSTYFNSKEAFPSSFDIVNGVLVPQNDSPDISGNVYMSDQTVSITPTGGLNSIKVEYSSEESQSKSYTQSITSKGHVKGGIVVGVSVWKLDVSNTTSVDVSFGGVDSVMSATINTKSISTSVEYVELPSHVDNSYSYTANQLVWVPTNVKDGIDDCPLCIVGSVVNTKGNPLYIPQDFHIGEVTDNTVTLRWTNPDFDMSPYDKRTPEEYEIYQESTGNINFSTPVKTVDGEKESVKLTVKPNKTYTFCIKAKSGAKESVLGPAVSITTGSDNLPIITSQPVDQYANAGDTVTFSVKAQPRRENTTLSYQWQKLTTSRYGSVWVDMYNEKSDTLKVSAYKDISSSYNNNFYRCVVVENAEGEEPYNVVSNTVKISVAYCIEDYQDLCDVAQLVNSQKPLETNLFVLTNDIEVPQGAEWTTPIGTEDSPFCSTFDGCGYTINGLYRKDTNSSEDYFALFGYAENASIKNVNLDNLYYYIAKADAAAVCGKADDCYFYNCSVNGTVINAASQLTGGICASAQDTKFESCMNFGNVYTMTDGCAGGICGYSIDSEYVNCGNVGVVENSGSSNTTAGIVGDTIGKTTVNACYNYGNVSSQSRAKVNAYPICRDLTDTLVTNSYYREGCVVVKSEVTFSGTAMTEDDFKNGKVTFLLNNGVMDGTQAFYQDIDDSDQRIDLYPVLKSNGANTVYGFKNEFMEVYKNYIIGDVDGDSAVTVMDATIIQKYLVQSYDIDDLHRKHADVNCDGDISIMDATYIQCYVAKH